MTKLMLSKIDFRQSLIIALSIVIFTTPLGILTIKGWAGYHLFICVLLSLILLWMNRQSSTNLNISNRSQIHIIAWIFSFPFLATLTSQLLRNDFNLPALDSPARFIFAIPILYGLVASKVNISRLLIIAIPVSVIATYLLIPYLPEKGWALDTNRLATYSVDPLTFGKIALSFGLMSALIAIENIHKKFIFVIATFGLILGIYMSIESQSRTGWLSVLLVVLFLFFHFFRNAGSITKKIIGSIIISATLLTPFLTNPQALSRLSQAIHELQAWQPSKDTVNTSVGMRISFWRIGAQLFIEKPITGWGKDGFKKRLDAPDFRSIASQYTTDYILGSGFHSDIMQNAILSGLSGLIAYLSIFLVPLVFFVKFYLKSQSCRLISGLGIIYVYVELVSSLSTEVLSLKSTASFYGLMIAFFMAGSFNMKNQQAKLL